LHAFRNCAEFSAAAQEGQFMLAGRTPRVSEKWYPFKVVLMDRAELVRLIMRHSVGTDQGDKAPQADR
jgi:hypothetical protein